MGEIYMELRCKLSILMGKYRFTIEELHKKTGIARGTISNLYHDKVKRYDSDVMVRLCLFFNCDISDLLVLEDNEETEDK